jgi:hypothetical protein
MDRCVALFEQGPDGTRLLGKSYAPELADLVAECLAASKRAELQELEPPQRRLEDQG